MTAALASAVEQALAAHARGSALPAPKLPNMEQRQGARYIVDMTRRLPEDEMALLAWATERREEALVHARAGDLATARAQLEEADRFVDENVPSAEGRLSARSFHAAAAAFVEHAEGCHDGAHELLIEALSLCRRLRADYGHTVEVRRVHLARNVARVVWTSGRHPQAWALCTGLLDYVWGARPCWPLGDATDVDIAHRERLREDERMFLSDQLLSEAISTVADARQRPVPLDAGLPADAAFPERVGAVVRLCGTAVSSDETSLVGALGSYFEAGQGALPMTWRRAERWFQDLTGAALPTPAAR